MDTRSQEAPAEEVPPYRPHIGPTLQYVRDIVLGVNDGLVSMFLLVAGVVGAGFATREVFLSAIAGSLAGAVSMAVGEYIATKSQEETFEREMALEREHLAYHRDVERDEIREMFGDMGMDAETVESVVHALDRDDDAFMRVMMALEFGVVEEQRRNPYWAAAFSGMLFLLGSMPSTLPFLFSDRPGLGLTIAALLASAGLFLVGAVKTRVTDKNPVLSGTENLLLGVAGAAASFGVGAVLGAAL